MQIPQEIVPLKSRICVSAADTACATLQAFIASGAFTYYFTELRGLSLEWTGIAWLAFGIWNATNDPLFGWISDRTHSKLGRRLPYIRYGAPLFALSFILFWIDIPGTQSSQWELFLQMLLALFLFDTFYTAIATSVYIMPYEMAVSNQARSTIFLWKIIFSVFWVAVPLVIERTIKSDTGDLPGLALFRMTMIILGLTMGLIIYLSSFYYREKHFTQELSQFPFIKSLRVCFSNRAFIIFETISFTGIFAQTALMQGLWLYFDEVNNSPIPLYIALAIGVVLGVIFWFNRRDECGVKNRVRGMTLSFAMGCLGSANWHLIIALFLALEMVSSQRFRMGRYQKRAFI